MGAGLLDRAQPVFITTSIGSRTRLESRTRRPRELQAEGCVRCRRRPQGGLLAQSSIVDAKRPTIRPGEPAESSLFTVQPRLLPRGHLVVLRRLLRRRRGSTSTGADSWEGLPRSPMKRRDPGPLRTPPRSFLQTKVLQTLQAGTLLSRPPRTRTRKGKRRCPVRPRGPG